MELQCKRGRLSRLHYFGAISDKKHLKLTKKNDDDEFMSVGHDFCGPSTVLSKEANCSDALNTEQMIKDYDKKCADKNHCTFDFTKYLSVDLDLKKARPDCFGQYTQIYAQVSCDLSHKEMTNAK